MNKMNKKTLAYLLLILSIVLIGLPWVLFYIPFFEFVDFQPFFPMILGFLFFVISFTMLIRLSVIPNRAVNQNTIEMNGDTHSATKWIITALSAILIILEIYFIVKAFRHPTNEGFELWPIIILALIALVPSINGFVLFPSSSPGRLLNLIFLIIAATPLLWIILKLIA